MERKGQGRGGPQPQPPTPSLDPLRIGIGRASARSLPRLATSTSASPAKTSFTGATLPSSPSSRFPLPPSRALSYLSLSLSLSVRTGDTQPPQLGPVEPRYPSVEMDGGAEGTARSPASTTTTDWRRLWSSGEPSRAAHSEELGRAEERRI